MSTLELIDNSLSDNKVIKFPSIHYDDAILISVGKSRKEMNWINEKMMWSDLVKKLSQPIRTQEKYESYLGLAKTEQDDIKDVGGFIGGSLKSKRRKAENLESRQIITLDADFAPLDFWEIVTSRFNYNCLIYSTHKHSVDTPRYRLVIPLERAVTADEYQAISRKIANDIGIHFFDSTTFEPLRMMYWPSASTDGVFEFEYSNKSWVDPNQIIASYEDWKDSSTWPRDDIAIEKHLNIIKKQGDPREKAGMIGAFCRTYNIHNVIEKFLSDIYTITKDYPDRYTYADGSSTNGLVVYEDGDFAYSFHGTDPVSCKLCNAFDLVRLHKFGELDDNRSFDKPIADQPSQKKMIKFATADIEVKKLLIKERMNSDEEDDNDVDWQRKLQFDDKGKLMKTLTNLNLVVRHDPNLKEIYYNEFREGIDVEGNVKWKRFKRGWNKTDQAGIASYIDRTYCIYSKEKLSDAVLNVSVERSRHPVRDYLNNLPKWDRKGRLDCLLIDYLGAEDNTYIREVTRKTFVAAINRVMNPGVKFDTVLVLIGPQGIGKSTLIAKLGGEYYSDSLSIADMRDKTAAEKLQGYWINEIGELNGMRKVDEETLKSFLSRQDDKYRASYGYSVEDHPRQCIIIGTTNHEKGFLRDITGGRRFWPVKVSGDSHTKPWNIEDVDQIWAEALLRYHENESLILSSEAEKLANEARTDAFESDDREGLVRAYLDMRLHKGWDYLCIEDRQEHIKSHLYSSPTNGKVRKVVCNMEIWCELFGKDRANFTKHDSYTISAIMQKIEGWEKYTGNQSGSQNVSNYGKQRVYVRE